MWFRCSVKGEILLHCTVLIRLFCLFYTSSYKHLRKESEKTTVNRNNHTCSVLVTLYFTKNY